MKPNTEELEHLEKLKEETGKRHYLKKIKNALPWFKGNKRFGTSTMDLYWFRGEWRTPFYLEEKLGVADVKNKLAWGMMLTDSGLELPGDIQPIPVLSSDIGEHITLCMELADIIEKEYISILKNKDIKYIDRDEDLARMRYSISELRYITNKPKFLSDFITIVTGDVPDEKQLAILARKVADIIINIDPSRSARNTRFD